MLFEWGKHLFADEVNSRKKFFIYSNYANWTQLRYDDDTLIHLDRLHKQYVYYVLDDTLMRSRIEWREVNGICQLSAKLQTGKCVKKVKMRFVKNFACKTRMMIQTSYESWKMCMHFFLGLCALQTSLVYTSYTRMI